jgi:hypothetical protein
VLDIFKISQSTEIPKLTLKTEFIGDGPSVRPGFNGRKLGKKTLPDFPGVATGNLHCRMEQFGGRIYGRPRVDCRL